MKAQMTSALMRLSRQNNAGKMSNEDITEALKNSGTDIAMLMWIGFSEEEVDDIYYYCHDYKDTTFNEILQWKKDGKK